MSSSTPSDKDEENSKVKSNIKVENQDNEVKGSSEISYPNYYDDFFETFRQNIQNMANLMEKSWSSTMPTGMRTSSPYELFKEIAETRLPLCDVIDKGDKYEINLEIPGISKEKVDLKVLEIPLEYQPLRLKEQGKEVENMYIARDHTSHFIDRFLLQKKLFLPR